MTIAVKLVVDLEVDLSLGAKASPEAHAKVISEMMRDKVTSAIENIDVPAKFEVRVDGWEVQ